jgi:hypothetical protein
MSAPRLFARGLNKTFAGVIARMSPTLVDLGEVILADGSRVAPGPSTALRPPFRLRSARDDRDLLTQPV